MISNSQEKLEALGKPSRLANLLALPAIIISGVAAAALASAVMAVLLVPGSIIAFLVWRQFRKLKQQQEEAAQDILEAEYTVIKDDKDSSGGNHTGK